MTSARENWRAIATECHAQWRLSAISIQRDWHPQQEIVKICIGEIAEQRLLLAYLPIFQTLRTMEQKLWLLMKACAYDDKEKWRGSGTASLKRS